MDRRAFLSIAVAGAASPFVQTAAQAAQPAPKARNVVLAHVRRPIVVERSHPAK
jgi:hypothetical protein